MKSHTPIPPPHRSRRRAFTLIELLTVIAITSVLLTIVVAGVRNARQSADRVTCATNLRQIGVAANLYAQENEGKFPLTGLYNRGRRPWDQTGLIDKLEPYVQSYKIFYCPSYTLESATSPGLKDHTYDVQLAKSESDSSRFAYISYFWTVSNGGSWSVTPQSVDGEANRVLASCVYFFPAQVRPHGGNLNFLFADGHVDSRSKKNDVWGDIDRATLLFK